MQNINISTIPKILQTRSLAGSFPHLLTTPVAGVVVISTAVPYQTVLVYGRLNKVQL